MNITEKLDQLANMYSERDALELKKQELINSVMTPEIKTKIDDIEDEFFIDGLAIDGKVIRLEAEIKTDVIQAGATVKGDHLMAVWAKGREGGWDSGKLKGFAMAHPEIMAAKKPDGEPTVSIRKV